MQIISALLLADGRLPVGGHAHSGGIEEAVDEGAVHDVASLEAFLLGRLLSSGRIDAHFASRSCACFVEQPDVVEALIDELDVALDARLPSPATRAISRAQGGAFLSVSARVLSSSLLNRIASTISTEPHLAVAIGLSAAAAGLDPQHAASLACYHAVAGPASAALRLLGLDPVAVAACVHHMTSLSEQIAAEAAANRAALPAPASPLLDLFQERHNQRKERLFAS